MCCKKWLKNIYQSICGLWFVKLVKRILISVKSQLLLTIIVICIVVKFFPDKIANFLGIKTDTGEIMSFIELIIEGIFCVLVLKEFKMTRKSFEWQKKEQEEKKDKEADFRLNEIVKYFLDTYFDYIDTDIEQLGDRCRYFCNNLLNIDNLQGFELTKQVEGLLIPYQIDCDIHNIETKERKLLEEIFYRIIFKRGRSMFLGFFLSNRYKTLAEEDMTEKKCIRRKITNCNITKGSAKTMNLDYDILEKIYNNIYLKQYAN